MIPAQAERRERSLPKMQMEVHGGKGRESSGRAVLSVTQIMPVNEDEQGTGPGSHPAPLAVPHGVGVLGC